MHRYLSDTRCNDTNQEGILVKENNAVNKVDK